MLYQNCSFFGYETGWYSEQPPEPPSHTSWERFHRRMNFKLFLMFTVAENTGSVNISIYISYSD